MERIGIAPGLRGRLPFSTLGLGAAGLPSRMSTDIVAVDNAPELVEHYRQQGINIRLGDAYRVPYPEEYFEGVFCCWLLEHLVGA